jgi:hypothetical protein
MSKNLALEMAERESATEETGLSLELQDWKGLNKASIKEKVDAVVTTIHDGWVDPIEALIFAKKGSEVFALLEKNVREFAEAKGVGKDGIDKFNVKLSEAMTGVKYDYSGCGDVTLDKLQKESAELDIKIKARQKFLQTVTGRQITGDSDTGEAWEVTEPIKSGKLGIKCEIK